MASHYGDEDLKMVFALRDEYDKVTPRKSESNSLKHVYSFSGGIGEGLRV
jgi:hypothetical protein